MSVGHFKAQDLLRYDHCSSTVSICPWEILFSSYWKIVSFKCKCMQFMIKIPDKRSPRSSNMWKTNWILHILADLNLLSMELFLDQNSNANGCKTTGTLFLHKCILHTNWLLCKVFYVMNLLYLACTVHGSVVLQTKSLCTSLYRRLAPVWTLFSSCFKSRASASESDLDCFARLGQLWWLESLSRANPSWEMEKQVCISSKPEFWHCEP